MGLHCIFRVSIFHVTNVDVGTGPVLSCRAKVITLDKVQGRRESPFSTPTVEEGEMGRTPEDILALGLSGRGVNPPRPVSRRDLGL